MIKLPRGIRRNIYTFGRKCEEGSKLSSIKKEIDINPSKLKPSLEKQKIIKLEPYKFSLQTSVDFEDDEIFLQNCNQVQKPTKAIFYFNKKCQKQI